MRKLRHKEVKQLSQVIMPVHGKTKIQKSDNLTPAYTVNPYNMIPLDYHPFLCDQLN